MNVSTFYLKWKVFFFKKIEELPTHNVVCREFRDIFQRYIDIVFDVYTTSGVPLRTHFFDLYPDVYLCVEKGFTDTFHISPDVTILYVGRAPFSYSA